LLFYGLSGSEMRLQAERDGLHFVSEVFADRGYRVDGSLVPRGEAGALIDSPDLAVAQVLKMVQRGVVDTDGGEVAIAAETICLHGDGAHAVEFARLIRHALTEKGVRIMPPVVR
jgi:UPF0271 protein